MTSKIYVVTDLGPGDGGKGGVVHKICEMMKAHTVIKRGGAQGSHGVRTSTGEQFAFSQWGCGTFSGIPTHISEQMIVSPEGLLNEAADLRYTHGIHDVFSLLTVDERALCATPFHGIASRLKELARGNNPRGTIGTGVGEAYRSYQQQPDLAIMAGDLKSPDLRDRLAAIREQVRSDLEIVVEGEFLAKDRAILSEETALLQDDGFLDYVVGRFTEASKQVQVVSYDFLSEKILTREGVAVVETSHGVLTDRLAGFHPHTSAIRTLPCFTHDMLKSAGYEEQVINIGITRAYAIRHGAGPMPTSSSMMKNRLLDGSAKNENRYQGKIRVGPLDFVLLKYAIEACGGPATFDGLAVTWFDQILADEVWEMCHTYNGADDPNFFSPLGAIKFDIGAEKEQLKRQSVLTERLYGCSPVVSRCPISMEASKVDLYDVCAETMQASVDVPVRMISFGPTELDKLCK